MFFQNTVTAAVSTSRRLRQNVGSCAAFSTESDATDSICVQQPLTSLIYILSSGEEMQLSTVVTLHFKNGGFIVLCV